MDIYYTESNEKNKTLTILDVERLPNTIYGNPMYKVKTLQGDFTTQANSGHVYSFEYRKLEKGDVINVLLTKNNRIKYAIKVD